MQRIAIVGGDVCAWVAAAILARRLDQQGVEIIVVEPSVSMSFGALSSSPAINLFHRDLQLTELDVLRDGGGAFKLGFSLQGFNTTDQIVAFTPSGAMLEGVEFHHYTTRLAQAGRPVTLSDHSIGAIAARSGRFGLPPRDVGPPLSQLVHGLHLNEARYCDLLKGYALGRGVRMLTGDMGQVTVSESGTHIADLSIEGQALGADFYIDATPTGALVDHLQPAFEDWSCWLPVDLRWDLATTTDTATPLLTDIIVTDVGWTRTIPLPGERHHQRFAASAFLEPGDTGHALVRALRTGCLRNAWQGNCLAIGAACGDLGEVVVDTVHLAQSAMLRWLDRYPDRACEPLLAEEHNRITLQEYERIRDVHLLHLKAASNHRASPFWSAVREIDWPETLGYRIELFEQTGKLAFYEGESLAPHNWITLLLALGVQPRRYDGLAERVDLGSLQDHLRKTAAQLDQAVLQLPLHDQLLANAPSAPQPVAGHG